MLPYHAFTGFTNVKSGSDVLEYASITERVVEVKKQKTITLKKHGLLNPRIRECTHT